MLEFIVGAVCAADRCCALIDPKWKGGSALTEETIANVQETWSTMIRSDSTVGRNYLLQLIDRIEVDENRITVVPKEAFSTML